jgi:hypothetical protein
MSKPSPAVAQARPDKPRRISAIMPPLKAVAIPKAPLEPTWQDGPGQAAVAFIMSLDLRQHRLDFAGARGTGAIVVIARELTIPSSWARPSSGSGRPLVLIADQLIVTESSSAPPKTPGVKPFVIVARQMNAALVGSLSIYLPSANVRCTGPSPKKLARHAPSWCSDDEKSFKTPLAQLLQQAALAFATRVSPVELTAFEAAGMSVWSTSWLGAHANQHAAWTEKLARKAKENELVTFQLDGSASQIPLYILGETKSVCADPRFLINVSDTGDSADGEPKATMLDVSGGAGSDKSIGVSISGQILPALSAERAVRAAILLPDDWQVRCVLRGTEKLSSAAFDGEDHPGRLDIKPSSVGVTLKGPDLTIFDRFYVALAYDAVDLVVELPGNPRIPMVIPGVGLSQRSDPRVRSAQGAIVNGGLGAVSAGVLVNRSLDTCALAPNDTRIEVPEGESEKIPAACKSAGWSLDPRTLIYRDSSPEKVARLVTGQGLRYFFVANYLAELEETRVVSVDLKIAHGAQTVKSLQLFYSEMRTVPFFASAATEDEELSIEGVLHLEGGGERTFTTRVSVIQGALFIDDAVLGSADT